LVGLSAWLIGAGATPARGQSEHADEPSPGPGERPAPALRERETVRRHLLDVSVLAPGEDTWRSAAGIPRDAFEVLVDGEPLPEPRRSMMEFDEICIAGDGSDPPRLPSLAPTLLVVADLNYLDVGMRHATARALEDLAEMMTRRHIRVKVLAYTRTTTPLTPGFTTDPDRVRQASSKLLETLSPGPPLGDPERGADRRSETPEGGDVDPRLEPGAAGEGDPAFQLVLPGSSSGEIGTPEPSLPDSPSARLMRQAVDPRPSLAALESVMISHAAIPGRKAVVLFSSGWFELPEELWLSYLMQPLHAAQSGFVLWTVNASGLGSGGGLPDRSALLGHLAGATGGGRVRGAGRLAVAFERAIEQLSCYYLFSVPVPTPSDRSERHTVTVSLDTERYPDLWTYKVRAPASFVLLDDRTRAERQRLAALMEPGGYGFPNVRINPSYPAGGDGAMAAPIEVSVRLSDLLFEEIEAGGEPVARFAWEGVVTDAADRSVCRLGDGRVRRVSMDRPPLSAPSARLVLRTFCELPGAGRYEVRAVVEDLNGDSVGAARAGFRVFEPSESTARISALRLGRNSGNDFLLDLDDAAEEEVPRDRLRRAFVPLEPDEALDAAEQLMVRFVACRSDKPPHVVLYERGSEGGPPRAMYQLLVMGRAKATHDEVQCQEYEAVLPGSTLSPGRYGVALFPHDVDATTREDVDRLLSQGDAALTKGFGVRPRRSPGYDLPAPGDPA
jgi:hypothetical protein